METELGQTPPAPLAGPVERVSLGIGRVVALFFVVIVAITAYEVVMRYLFLAPTIWVHDLAVALCALGFVFAGPVALALRQHIAITAIYERFGPRGRRRLDVVNSILTIAYLAVLVYATLLLARPAVDVMETTGTAWNVPIPMILKVSLFLGACLMLAQALSNLVTDVRTLLAKA